MNDRSSDDEHKDVGRGRSKARTDARAFTDIAAQLFELPHGRLEKFPGSGALYKALLINRTHMVKNALKRHQRHIAGLLRNEGFTVDGVRAFIEGKRVKADVDEGPDLEAIRESLCDAETFEGALTVAARFLPVLDTQAVRRYANSVHETDDRKAYTALYKVLREAADRLEEDNDET